MRPLFALFCCLFLCLPPLYGEDVAGSEDHPLVTRYPGSRIAWYLVENHRPFRLPVGPVTGYRHINDWIDTAGRVTRIYYTLSDADRTHSEVHKNYRDALAEAGFTFLAEGLFSEGSRRPEIGSRQWQEIYIRENPFNAAGEVSQMAAGSASSGGSGSLVATKERAAGAVYVAGSTYQFRSDQVSILVDIVEVGDAESGRIVVDAEAIGRDIAENGRVVLDGILFDYDKATLKAESGEALTQIAAFLKADPARRFYVVGHTDARGELAYNLSLSRDRARAVVNALVKEYGVDGARLEPHGVGPLVPVFSNGSDAGREKNRRVELVER